MLHAVALNHNVYTLQAMAFKNLRTDKSMFYLLLIIVPHNIMISCCYKRATSGAFFWVKPLHDKTYKMEFQTLGGSN